MPDPVIVVSPAPIADGQNTTLDTSAFNNKLAATDNLLQELADKFDDHTHAMAELSAFLPPNDNLTDLGSGVKRFKDIYAGNAVIQTSDRNYKEDIRDINNAWAFVDALRPREFKFKGGTRVHTGFIAQDVKEALSKDYAIYCEQQGVCGLRYEEAIAPMVWCIQDLRDSSIHTDSEISQIVNSIADTNARVSQISQSDRDLHTRLSTAERTLEAVCKDIETFSEVLEDGSDSVSIKEHRATVEALVSRLADLENKKEAKPTNWVSWAAIGISIIAGLCHFL